MTKKLVSITTALFLTLLFISTPCSAEPDPDDDAIRYHPTQNPSAAAQDPGTVVIAPAPLRRRPRPTPKERRELAKVCPGPTHRTRSDTVCALDFLGFYVFLGEGSAEMFESYCCKQLAKVWGKDCLRTITRIVVAHYPAWKEREQVFDARIDKVLNKCSSSKTVVGDGAPAPVSSMMLLPGLEHNNKDVEAVRTMIGVLLD